LAEEKTDVPGKLRHDITKPPVPDQLDQYL